MTTMLFDYRGQSKRIDFTRVVCFHGQVMPQEELSEIILDGLNGVDKNFLLDNTGVKKKTLNVIDFSNGLITDDLKMTSKSFNLKIMREIIEKYEKKDLLAEQLSEKMGELQELINNRYKTLREEYPQLIKLSIGIESLEDLIINQFSLIDKNKVTNAVSKELQLSLIIDYIRNHSNEMYYLILHQFNESLDLSEMLFILDKIMSTENLVCIILTNSSSLYYHSVDIIKHYFLFDDHIQNEFIYELSNLEILSFLSLLTEEEIVEIGALRKKMGVIRKYEDLFGERKDFVRYFSEKYYIDDV